MGFIKAFSNALGGSFAEQWKEFIVPIENVPSTASVYKAVLNVKNNDRGVNEKKSENIITNGSKIIVPEGTALITMQDGAITGCITEPGGFIFSSKNQDSKSFFAGNGIISSTLKTSWERFKYGGVPRSEQTAVYVNLKEIPGNKFGTQSEIYWNDKYINAQVGAKTRGVYSIKISDPILFIKNFVPAKYLRPESNYFDMEYGEDKTSVQLFNEIVSCLSAAFSNYVNEDNKKNQIMKIQSDQVGFAKSLANVIEKEYKWKEDRGIEIVKVAIAGIDYDEESRKLLNDVNKAEALSGNRSDTFMKQSIARGIEEAGSHSGGSNIAFMGMGLNALGNSVGETKQNSTKNEIDVEKLKQLKQLFDDGVITQEEFDKAKKKYLGI
ncbi:MAG: SPFH domain-containing protein [Clostridia bacterium]|nr:SPFH domain-containing protein [Clostridia bacterium]